MWGRLGEENFATKEVHIVKREKSMEEKERKFEELGKRLRREREGRSLTQKELAELIGVTEMTVYRWESGESQPRAYARRKLMKALHLKKETFFSEEEPQTEQHTLAVPAPARQEALILPPPITKIYRGWRTGNFDPHIPGEEAPLVWWSDGQGGETHVTVNDYPLYPYYTEELAFNPHFDWGRISIRSRQLVVSLLANYFGETGPRGWDDKGDYQSKKYSFRFHWEVVAFLPYEKWELSSDQIARWLEREVVRMQIESSK